MAARSCCAALALVLATGTAAAPAQDAALGANEAKVRWVAGRPMLRATLRAGEKVYYCHLLVDLSATNALFLHANAAGVLRAASCSVEAGGITLTDLPFEARRDRWLEGLTAQFAEELQQVPVAGILGLPAFAEHDVLLDGPNDALKLLPPASAAVPAPPASASLAAVPLVGDLRRGLAMRCDLGNGVLADLRLHTREPFSWLEPGLCAQAGAADGVLERAVAGPFVDLAKWTPFRPLRAEGGGQGGLGGTVLRQLAVTIQPAAGRIVFAIAAEPVYPATEAAFYRAMHGADGTALLERFLAEHGTAEQAAAAAATWLERVLPGGDLQAAERAGLAVVRTAPEHRRATAALEVLDRLPATMAALPARAAVAEAALAEARADEDGNAVHKLRLELGAQQRALGNRSAARRHLLSAVFGMPASGPANLELGHWHRDGGETDAALGRYFLALLDMRTTGQQGYAAFAELFGKTRGPEGDLLAELQDRADGRVPSFQPIRRPAGSVRKTGRTVLVELFTGAMCPPCVAADVGGDALQQFFDRDELVLVQWHLPVPAPEPLVAPASLARAEGYGIGSTPTVVVAGGERVVGGGKADAAPELFLRYRGLVEAELRKPPAAIVRAEAACTDAVVRLTATVEAAAAVNLAGFRLHAVLVERLVVFPGSNGMLFHHAVARAAFTPTAGLPVTLGAPAALSLDLARVGDDLDAHVATYEGDAAFLVRPVRPAVGGLEVVVFVQDASGAVLQAAAVPVQRKAGR